MRTVYWENGLVRMIDQRKLPWELEVLSLDAPEAVVEAIRNMSVRGAPAIGATAAFGMALTAVGHRMGTEDELIAALRSQAANLKAARPTAVNLAWAVDRIMALANALTRQGAGVMAETVISEAQRLADEDVFINRTMALHGAALIQDGATVLHHCNTGALATVDYGTALGVVRAAHEQGKRVHVLLDETRPRMQGGRLSAWELDQLGVSFDIIPDTAAGYFLRKGEVDVVLVGADRIAANGDFANKIGTYQLAVLAKENGVPFFTVAPTSTVDLALRNGAQIPIEERDGEEVTTPYGVPLYPPQYPTRNPAFDVTPNRYLSGIVTENGIASAPFLVSLRTLVEMSRRSDHEPEA
jgi:methylthioribose-1-phosphate isomerase